MCDKFILENGGTLKSAPDCCKNQEMCNEGVDNYPHAIEYVPECYKTEKCVISYWYLSFYNKMCSSMLYDSRSVSIRDRYKSQGMWDNVWWSCRWFSSNIETYSWSLCHK